MASFKAKIGWKRPRKRKNKNYRYVPFRSYPTLNRKFQKNSKNIQNVNKYHYGLISSKKSWKRMRKRENKNYHYVSFQPDAQ